MANLRTKSLSMVGFSLLLGACGGSAGGDEVDRNAVTAEGVPIITEYNGRLYKLREAWSDADFERILYEGRPDQPSTTPQVLAAQMRTHSIQDGHYYIELEPNIEVAKRILSGATPEPTPAEEGREARTIIGTDTRAHWGNHLIFPATAMGFNNSRGSGAKIAAHSMYTAAHVIYETYETTNGWYCANETISPAGTCNPFPSWRFGVEGTSGFTAWTAQFCYRQSITNAFIGLVKGASVWDKARWDYAAIDTSGCTDGGTSWFGTLPATDQQLLDATGWALGYAARATCPTGADGDVGSFGQNIDCPGTGAWPGSTWQLTGAPGTAPYIGARLWFSSDTNVSRGDANAAFSIKSTIDVTHGNSGGPLYMTTNGVRQVLGTCTGQTSAFTVHNRWSTEVYNFLHANSPFPQP